MYCARSTETSCCGSTSLASPPVAAPADAAHGARNPRPAQRDQLQRHSATRIAGGGVRHAADRRGKTLPRRIQERPLAPDRCEWRARRSTRPLRRRNGITSCSFVMPGGGPLDPGSRLITKRSGCAARSTCRAFGCDWTPSCLSIGQRLARSGIVTARSRAQFLTLMRTSALAIN